MTDLEKQIDALVREQRYEEAAELKAWHVPSRSITQAIIRWIDARRTKHKHAWKAHERLYLENFCGGWFQKDPGRFYTHIKENFRCHCGATTSTLSKQ